jgi:ABC-type sulfate/molybdate transport systems ATPase subunit
MNQVLIENLAVNRAGFHLSLERLGIESGEVLGVMGQSGSGKSTLLQALAGFVPLVSGTIKVFGNEISQLAPEKRKVSLVFQKPWLFENQTVLENISFGMKLQGLKKKEFQKTAEEWLRKMEIEELKDRRAWEISGGQAQRVALARAMAVNFPLLLLDEPFSALDSPLKKGLRKLVKQLVRDSGFCAVLVSHDWRDIEEVCHKVLILGEGKGLAYGTVHEVKQNSNPQVRAICED